MPRAHYGALFLALTVFLPGLSYAADKPIPGQNINMVSGRQWPGGDPFLQRQNEPSIAVSTRNPLHLLAGANDYRTVDLPLTDVLPGKEVVGDAWVGVFKSFDGGARWQSVLLNGYPQDNSPAGLASPIKGLTTAADAVVRAGTNGMFYYSGIAFNRGSNVGKLFVARFIDLDNKENGDVTLGQDPIRYINTLQIDRGNAGQFLDKPWLAVDIPRAGAGTCSIQVPQPAPLASTATVQSGTQATQTVNQTFPAGNVYLSYTIFVGNDNNIRTKLYFTRSTDCGASWSTPTKLSEGLPVNQGSVVQVDPRTGYVYVAWRQFASNNALNAIQVVRSIDGGQTFTKATPIVTLPSFSFTNPGAPSFFDQGTTGGSFRINAFPAMAIADSGANGVPGRVFVAWSQRGIPPNPISARIMLSSSIDGLTWSTPFAMDNNPITDDAILQPPLLPGHEFSRGHQFMPSMTFTEGKLMLLYYDQRLDHTLGYFRPNEPFLADGEGEFYRENRQPKGGAHGDDPESEIFTPFLTDSHSTSTPMNPLLLNRRHTVEVRVAQAAQTVAGNPGANPVFTYAQVSQYKFGTRGDETKDPITGADSITFLQQLQVNPLGLPLFQSGCCPFAGDYIDIAGLNFLPPGAAGGTLGGAAAVSANSWKFNTAPVQNSVHVATYTSNQDVRPPIPPATWQDYTPAGTGLNRTSVFDGTRVPDCKPGREGMRNQNIYSSRITGGLQMSSPQNNKPLDATLQRTFVVLAQNFTDLDRSFLLTIADLPPSVQASFLQFQPLKTLEVTIAAHSGIARSVFATASDPHAIIRVNAMEINPPNGSVPLSSFVVLNADSTSPSLINPDGAGGVGDIAEVEIYTPNISNPNVSNPNVSNPNVSNPNVSNPNVSNPNISNPNVSNPNVSNPDIADPNVSNPNVSNPNVSNPNISNPNVSNSNVSDDPVSDATYSTTNNGNTGAAYNIKLVGTSPTPLQLIVNKVHLTPAALNCELFEQTNTILQSNVINIPLNPPPGDINNIPIGNPSIFLAPGESALITIRGDVDEATMESIVTGITPVVTAQAANTGEETPRTTAALFITTAEVPPVIQGGTYNETVAAIGGRGAKTWSIFSGSLPPGLNLNSTTGVISGTATTAGTFNFTVQVQDSDTPPATSRRALSITVQLPVIGLLAFVQHPTSTHGGQIMSPAVTVRATDTTGAVLPGVNITLSIAKAACSTATLSGTLTKTTDATGVATFDTLSINRGGFGYALRASASGAVAGSSGFDIYGFCAGPSMTTSRFNPTVTPMSNGEALVAGGAGEGGALQTAERYIFETNVFLATEGSMTTSRFNFHAATALRDGRVLLSGGRGGEGSAFLSSAELYNPEAGSFAAAGNMTVAREGHTMTTLTNGIVLIAGGAAGGGQTTSAELYDPFKGTFSAIGPMEVARGKHTATLLNNGLVLIAGGSRTSAVAEIFDPETLQFRTIGSMTTIRTEPTATKLANGKVLITGGNPAGSESESSLASAELFDPVTETFSATGSMAFPRFFHTGSLLPSGQVLVAGGEFITSPGFAGIRVEAELYDPSSGTFRRTGDLIQGRAQHSAILRQNGTALIIGGPAVTEVYFSPSAIVVNEAAAVASIRTINAAQTAHLTIFPNLGYASRLSQLGPEGANLIDATLGCQTLTCIKSGYGFTLDGPVDTPRLQYFLKAIPQAQGQTGVRSFCSTETGTFVQRDGGDIASRDACLALPPI